MANMVGSDFDPAVPADTEGEALGASRIRDVKQRLINVFTVMFDRETGLLKNSVVTSAMLADVSPALAPGTYNNVALDAKGRATGASNVAYATGIASPNQSIAVAIAAGIISVDLALGKPFMATATITSAAAAAPINIVPDGSVPPGQKLYLTHWHAKVNGPTVWATTATVKIQDTAAVDFVTMAVAALIANAFVTSGTANTVAESAFALGVGGTAAKGLQLKGDANGTGSDLVVTVFGWIK